MTIHPKDQATEALRTHFEALASDPSFKLSRSRRGTYVNPAVARDWKWFQLGASQAQQPAPARAPVWQGKWAWVPVEPSTAMLIAGNHGQPGDFSALKVWHDMLGALERSFDYTRPVDPPSTTPAAQADSVPAQCPYSIDADPQGIRAMVADAITGALAFGAQGSNPPPEGHWLAPFWNAARADHSQADSVLKGHQIAALVNELRDIAVEFHGTQQLRERIAQVVVPVLKVQKANRVLEDAAPDHIRALIAQHAAILDQNESAYFELAYHRVTGWMAWITDKPLCMPPVINPDRKVLAQGQGDTAEEACADAALAQKESKV